MEKAMERANVLIEALPYIRRFRGKTLVIKYGGSTITDEHLKKDIVLDVVLLKFVGMHPVLVHGGGPVITQALRQAGKGSRFIRGLRITDGETIEIVEKVLVEKINREIVTLIEEAGGKAVAVDGRKPEIKGRRCLSFKEKGKKINLGFVGEVEEVSTELRKLAIGESIPVIAPLAVGKDGETLNVNADEMAASMAEALQAEKLVLLTDVPGIMRDAADTDSLIATLKLTELEALLKESIVAEGMIPKVNAAAKAIRAGVGKVHIIDGRISHSLLLEIFTDRGVGTEIIE